MIKKVSPEKEMHIPDNPLACAQTGIHPIGSGLCGRIGVVVRGVNVRNSIAVGHHVAGEAPLCAHHVVEQLHISTGRRAVDGVVACTWS